jgi:type II secretory pathway pseudopilin PulG
MNKEGKSGFSLCHGQSVLEIIIAMAVFSLISASLASLMIGSFSSLGRSGDIAQAEALADEGAEAVRAVRDRDWYGLDFSEAVIQADGGRWTAASGTGELIGDKYLRTIVFYPVYRDADGAAVSATATGAVLDEDSKKVRVRTEWTLDNGNTSYAERVFHLANWDYALWQQSDWSGGSGQAVWDLIDRYGSDDGNISVTSSGVSLAEVATSTYAVYGYLVSSAFDAGASSNFNTLSWQEEIREDCAACAIRFQLKTAATEEALADADWLGPAGTGDADDVYDVPGPEKIASVHKGDRWIMYKAILSGDSAGTPVLKGVDINYKN